MYSSTTLDLAWILFIIFATIILVLISVIILARNNENSQKTCLSDYTRSRSELPTRCGVVISLSTIPGRIKYINRVIDSMYNQYYRADCLYVNIPYYCKRLQKKYDDKELDYIDTKGGWVKINRCDDYGPATKLLGCIDQIHNPDTMIITVDDDHYYAPELVGLLVTHAKQYSDSVICTRSLRKDFKPTVCRGKLNLNQGEVIYVEGIGGILYRRKFITDTWFQHYSYYTSPWGDTGKECWLSDDMVFSNMLMLQGIPRIMICCDSSVRIRDDEIDEVNALWADRRSSVYGACRKNLDRQYRMTV